VPENDTDRDYAGAVGQLEADMARHQRDIAGAEVTADSNHRLAVDIVQRLERQHAEEARQPQAPAAPAPEQPAHEVERREINGHVYTLDKSTTDTQPYRTASQFEHDVIRHAMPRIEYLMTLKESGIAGGPSWHDRTCAAMYFKVKQTEARQSFRFDLVDEYERRFQQDLYELLEESNKSFGDWRKDAPKKLIITAGS
jgi:hypothetical protein